MQPEIAYDSNGQFNATWMVDAPWAHPKWSQCVLMLYDIKPHDNSRPANIYQDGANYEFMLFALDPDIRVDTTKPYLEQEKRLITPANYGYQFYSETDEKATKRVQSCVDFIERQRLSPDTDFRSTWDQIWYDAYPLVKRASFRTKAA